jgi:hypothetical protein
MNTKARTMAGLLEAFDKVLKSFDEEMISLCLDAAHFLENKRTIRATPSPISA